MSIFFDFVKTSLFRSKWHSFLSRISKNVSFWPFLLNKNIWKKVDFFNKNHGLTPLQNVDFFRLCENFTFEVQKTLFSIQNIKNFFFLPFLLKKNLIRIRSIFWQKPWTNPFEKCPFFGIFRTSLFRSKKLYFLSRISKNVSFFLFCSKKNLIRKRSIFWRTPWTKPFAKWRFFSNFLELRLSGQKRILYYPEYQNMFVSCFVCSKKNI